MAWETVIGLEVHVQLRTRTKMFCGDRTTFGDPPNTNVCRYAWVSPEPLPSQCRANPPGGTRRPGAGCTVHETSVFARKNYSIPICPKVTDLAVRPAVATVAASASSRPRG